jgi:hypothetical protein
LLEKRSSTVLKAHATSARDKVTRLTLKSSPHGHAALALADPLAGVVHLLSE